MSIKPIDFHLTYANTINESKAKQIDHNRVKESNQLAQHHQQVEIDKNLKRINQSEEAKGKIINKQDKNPNDRTDGEDSDNTHKQEANDNSKEKLPPKNFDNKGLKIDIMI